VQLAPFLAGARQLPAIIDLPSDRPVESYFPITSRTVVALDLQPLTSERVFRLAWVLASQVAENHLSADGHVPSEELWLSYSLPAYYAARITTSLGLLDLDAFLYDQREEYMSFRVTFDTLSRIGSVLDIKRRQFTANTLGQLVLQQFDRDLHKNGSSLDSVVRNTRLGSYIRSFRHSLAYSVGPFDGWRIWKTYVLELEPNIDLQSRLILEPIVLPLPRSAHPVAVVSAGLSGNLEMCGCKANQAGGAAKRASLFARPEIAHIAKLDLGNFSPRMSYTALVRESDRLERTLFYDLMARMRYDAVALGPNDISQLSALAATPLFKSTLSGNLPGRPYYKEVTTGKQTVTVMAWSDPSVPRRYDNKFTAPSVELMPTYEISRLKGGVKRAAAEQKNVILIGRIHPLTIHSLLAEPHSIKAILSSYDASGTDTVTVGRYKGVFVEFYSGDEGASIRYLHGVSEGNQIHITHSSFEILDDGVSSLPPILRDIDALYTSTAYLASISATGTREADAALGTAKRISRLVSSSYVGSQICDNCHKGEFEHWRSTSHSNAFKTLVEKRRHHNPTCVSCHVIGFGEATGYALGQKQRRLENVGCEVCHGPGADHVSNPSKSTIAKEVSHDLCLTCHTADHSAMPERLAEYWRKILHKPIRRSTAQ